MSQPAMAPPEGVVADLQNPTDVLRTVNFVTQALTLTLCSAFVFIRSMQKLRAATMVISVDDCECGLLRGKMEHVLSLSELTDLGIADLTVLSWLFLVAYCVAGVFCMCLNTRRRETSAYTDRVLIVSVHGGGYHLWEVTQEELVRYMKARISNIECSSDATDSAITRPCTLQPSPTL